MDIAVSYIFLIFSVANTIVVYLYQFICHDFWYNKIKNTFLVEKELSYIGLKKYSGDLYLKLLPFFVINFISTLFLNELDNYRKRIQKQRKFFRNSYQIDDLNKKNHKEKNEIINSNKKEDFIELSEKCKKEIFNLEIKLFGINLILIITKIYWIFLFLTICILFNSYYFSLSIAIYIIIFGITFIRMFYVILKNRNNYNNNNIITDDSLEIMERIKINRRNRELSFRFLVGYSFLIFFLYYIYGIFDISISYCNPKIWIGCNNKDNATENSKKNSDIIELIKSISFIFGVYYNTEKQGMLSVGWVHLFLCFLFCFDVYIQKIENYFSNMKTKKIIELDNKTLDSIWLRQKSLESQVDSLIYPNKINHKNKRQSTIEISGSLRDEIGKKIVENLSGAIKMYNLYKINKKRNKEKRKVMISIKYIFEEIIILILIISSIVKINIWSIIFLIFIFHFTFTKKSLEKFFYFYCLDIIGIIIQIILFVTNIQKSIIPRETDEEIFKIIKEHLGIPWLQSKDYIILSFIFGIGVDKNQTNTIYYEYLLIAIIYIYLDNFSYNLYNETDSNNRFIVPFVKGNILYDSMVDNPSLKNREININKKDFAEIKRVVRKNTFIEDVSALRYDDFLIALKIFKGPVDMQRIANVAKGFVIFIQTWMWYGYTAIVLISGVLGISPELFEAAEVDGANQWQTFFRVTIPSIKTMLLFTLVTSLIGGLNMFDIPKLFLNGGPNNATLTTSLYIYNKAFQGGYLYGEASAASMIMFTIIVFLSCIVFYLLRDKDEVELRKLVRQQEKEYKRKLKMSKM